MAICLSGLFTASALMGIAGWWSASSLGAKLDDSLQVSAHEQELAKQLQGAVYTFRLQERGMLLFSFIKADQQVAASRDSYDKAMQTAFESIRQMGLLLRTDRAREVMDQCKAGVENYKAEQLEVRKLLASGDVKAAAAYDREHLVPAGGKIVASLNQFDESMHSYNVTAGEEANRLERATKATLAIGFAGCVLLGVFVAVIVRRSTRKLQATAADLEQSARQVTGAAAQVSSSSESLARASSDQAASLQETSASAEQVNSMARLNTDKSRSAAELVAQSQEKFVLTDRSLAQTVAAMTEINAQSGKISNILKVIDEIAFQTNILALNAAVEAARAGEAGMGFAVVADEVRSLAQRCAQAAKDTAALVEESVTKSNDGKSKVDEVASAIRAITGVSAQVKTLVEEVNVGSVEQAHGIQQIGQAIAQMQHIVQQTAANAQEGASAAVHLDSEAGALKGIMDRLISLAGHAESSEMRQPASS